MPAAGELVIAEVMADPQASDDDVGEWVEVCAPEDGAAVSLAGVVLTRDGSNTYAVSEGATVQPGECVVLSDCSDGAPAALAESVCMDSLTLANGGGELCLLAGDGMVVDCMTYEDSEPGHALALCGNFIDAQLNDHQEYWSSRDDGPYDGEGEAGDHGTPGAWNPDCEEEPEDTAPPAQEGALIITEIMADPDVADDTDGEWVEICAAADGGAVSLAGLVLTRDGSNSYPVSEGGSLQPESCAVLSDCSEDAPAALADAICLESLSLTNSGGELCLEADGSVVDCVNFDGHAAGHALALCGNCIDADSNDDPALWSEAGGQPYDEDGNEGDYGSPGEQNPECPCIPSCNVPEPDPGELLLTELMPSAGLLSDDDGEWIEVQNATHLSGTDKTFPLNLLGLARGDSSSTASISSELCLGPGEIAVLGGSEDADDGQGWLDGSYSGSFALPSEADLQLVWGEALVDELSYGRDDWPSCGSGGALQLDSEALSAALWAAEAGALNDDPARWCCASEQDVIFKETDWGTPGQDNGICE